MKRLIVLSFAMVLLAFTAREQALGQGTTCQNGTCSNRRLTPVQVRVFQLEEMGSLEKKIVQMEKEALEKWYAGDPSAYIALMGDDIGYFEPGLEKRLDGAESLKNMFEALRGKIHADKFDMLNTRVQATETMAVLSCNLIAIEDGIPYRWNCTEVFELNPEGQWKLVHSHWSQTKPAR
ncbi:MAG: nuclear transport factor 2 family protein [Planctomycetaceae bacterium]|nr:nuclear transport factor 2 family protein [Planctomycetaceae bacterium]